MIKGGFQGTANGVEIALQKSIHLQRQLVPMLPRQFHRSMRVGVSVACAPSHEHGIGSFKI